jgi:hypothetical protein
MTFNYIACALGLTAQDGKKCLIRKVFFLNLLLAVATQ